METIKIQIAELRKAKGLSNQKHRQGMTTSKQHKREQRIINRHLFELNLEIEKEQIEKWRQEREHDPNQLELL